MGDEPRGKKHWLEIESVRQAQRCILCWQRKLFFPQQIRRQVNKIKQSHLTIKYNNFFSRLSAKLEILPLLT